MSNFLARFLNLQEIAAYGMYPRRIERLLEFLVDGVGIFGRIEDP